MKAQAYEVRALPTRQTAPSVYHFSLLSVVDTEIVRLLFSDASLDASEIDSEQYLANYIIQKKQYVSRIRFLRSSAFENAISEYDKLHAFNCKEFSNCCDEFYEKILEDWRRTRVLIDEFRNIVWWQLRWSTHKEYRVEIKKELISLSWDSDKQRVAVTIPIEREHLAFLNADTKSIDVTKKALKDVYRYSGPFIFDEEDVPF